MYELGWAGRGTGVPYRQLVQRPLVRSSTYVVMLVAIVSVVSVGSCLYVFVSDTVLLSVCDVCTCRCAIS